MIFLKDMSILAEYNLAYRWSSLDKYNTAVLSLNKKLAVQNNQLYGLFINDYMYSNVDRLISRLHPHNLADLVGFLTGESIFSYKSLMLFHSGMFDPAWLCMDRILTNPDPTLVCKSSDFVMPMRADPSRFSIDNFFPGAFAYHVHLSGINKLGIHEKSFFQYFEIHLESQLNINSDF